MKGESSLVSGFILSVFLMGCTPLLAGTYGGGSGTPEAPYQIWTPEHMNEIGLNQPDWGLCFRLMDNIDLGQYTGTAYNIIGTDSDHPFTGVFDGNGHVIYNFRWSSTGRDLIGLFGVVSGANAHIKNLYLIGPVIDADVGVGVGSLVAYNRGSITDCYVERASIRGLRGLGGLVGSNTGRIANCSVAGDIDAIHFLGFIEYAYFGGLVGYNNDGPVTNCRASVNIICAGNTYSLTSAVGGLVGHSNLGAITNCCATGNLYALDINNIGGLVGLNSRTVISNCYATGNVRGGW